MGVAANNGFAGNAALGAATLQTGMITQLGRTFQGADFSNRTSPGYQMLASALAGVTPAQYVTGSQSFQAGVQAKADAAFASQVLTPQITQWITQQVNQATGGKPSALTSDQAVAIGQQLLVNFFPQPQVLVAVLGPSLPANKQDANSAAQWLVQEVAKQAQGGIVGAANAQSQQATEAQLAQLHEQNGVATGLGGYSRIKLPGRGGKTGNASTVVTPGSGAAWGAYNSWAKGNGGQEDYAVAHILGALGSDPNAQVVVTTPSGKRVVSLADAVQNHRDELATGNVAIVGGKDAGRSVTDVVGQDKLDPSRNFSAEAKAPDNSGQSFAQWQAQHVKANGAIQSGGVTITLSNDARRLLTLMDTTGVAAGAGSASPPQNPFATFPSLPGVGG
jgi:hypothetical protein